MNNKKKDIFELNSSVLNLLGCNKENFKILMGELNYKLTIKGNIEQFKYLPKIEGKEFWKEDFYST